MYFLHPVENRIAFECATCCCDAQVNGTGISHYVYRNMGLFCVFPDSLKLRFRK